MDPGSWQWIYPPPTAQTQAVFPVASDLLDPTVPGATPVGADSSSVRVIATNVRLPSVPCNISISRAARLSAGGLSNPRATIDPSAFAVRLWGQTTVLTDAQGRAVFDQVAVESALEGVEVSLQLLCRYETEGISQPVVLYGQKVVVHVTQPTVRWVQPNLGAMEIAALRGIDPTLDPGCSALPSARLQARCRVLSVRFAYLSYRLSLDSERSASDLKRLIDESAAGQSQAGQLLASMTAWGAHPDMLLTGDL